MVGIGIPAQPAAVSGFSGSASVALANSAGAPIPVTASRSFTAADDGATLTNTGAAGAVTLTIPLGMRVGTSFVLYETDAFNFGVTATAGELIRISTSGTQLTCGAIAQGSTFRITKLTSTIWGLMYFVGSVG